MLHGAAGNGNGDVAMPVRAAERIASLDFIRGIAVMGILAVNIMAFGQPMSAYMYPGAFLVDPGDPGGWQWIAQLVVFDGKMRGLFALLFGTGMLLFMERAWERGSTRWLQAWRLAVLFVFGLLHFYLIWYGDILYLYAVIGCAALLFMKMEPGGKMRLALFLYLFGCFFTGGGILLDYITGGNAFGTYEEIAPAEAALAQLKLSGDYPAFIAERFEQQWFLPLIMPLFSFLEIFPLMLMGMALYQMEFFSGRFDPQAMRRWGWIGVGAGGAATLAVGLYVQSTGFSHAATSAAIIGWTGLPRLAMTLGLAALLVEYSKTAKGWLAHRISAAGRAAFSNYLGTSILMMIVFHGWGLGLFGALNRPQLYLVVVITWAIMLAWSKPWLTRFRYGPLEWVWRCLTYRRLFPIAR